MPNHPYPTFLVIGVAKGGTTALYLQLKEHPSIYMSPVKEPCFFNHDGYCQVREGEGRPGQPETPEAYKALFDGVTDETAVGEATADYIEVPEAAARIHAWNPAMKIVVVLRHPVDRAYSHYAMMQGWGMGEVPVHQPFAKIFRKKILNNPNWLAEPHQAYGCAPSLYYEGLKRYYDLFPREQIFVMKHDDMLRNAESSCEKIFTFLGVDPTFRPNTKRRVYVGQVPTNGLMYHMLVRPNLAKSIAQTVIPTMLRRPISQRIRGMLVAEKRDLDPKTRREFMAVYRDDTVKTQELTGVDLSDWLSS